MLHKERGRSLKGGFGFDPLLAYLDETREALAGVLRPGNAGANTASDHLRVLDLALEQLGQADAAGPIVVRTDSAGATHQFTDELREAHINFVMGYDLTAPVREAILMLPESAWTPAIRQDGAPREGAWVAEITDAWIWAAGPKGRG